MSWSDAFLTMALEEHCNRQSPPDLAEQILQRASQQAPERTSRLASDVRGPRPGDGNHKALLAAAAMVTVAIAAVLGVWHAASEQEAQGPESWLPLQRGTTWEYRVSDATGTWTNTETVLGEARFGDRDYHLVVSHRPEQPQAIAARLVAIDAAGIWQDRRWIEWAPDLGTPPVGRCLLPLPAAPDREWAWTGEQNGQRIEFHGEVLAIDERCKVAAGTFTTIRLRGTTTIAGETTVEEQWLARGVGLVRKRTMRGEDVVSTSELTRTRPGTGSWDPRMQLPTLLAKSDLHELGMPDEVREIELGVDALLIDSAFLRVRHGKDWQFWWLTRDWLTAFDPQDLAAWNELITTERLFTSPRVDPTLGALAICGVAGRIEAAASGYRVTGAAMREQWTGAVGRPTIRIDGRLPMTKNGKNELRAVHIDVQNGRLQSLRVR
ncbi:MAG: hypothetical protein NXI31_22255 [bacterium]|nr:hypothetical protein [bacterium]